MTVTILNWRTGAVLLTIAEATNCVGLQCAGFNLTDADFTGQNVRFSDFRGANLTGAKFDGCKTGQADFTGANISGATFVGEDTSTPTYTLSKMYYNAFNTSRVNDVIFRNSAIFTDINTGIQYATLYRRTLGRIVVCQRNLLPTPGAWSFQVSTQTIQNAADGHHDVAMALDGNSIAQFCWSWLDTSYIYWHGASPGDVAVGAPFSLPIVPGESAIEANPVYPEFISDASIAPDLMFTYWSVPSSNGTMLRRWDAATLTWSTVTAHLLHCGFNAYLARVQFDSQGRLWVPYNWRDTSDITTNYDLGVIVSDPADGPVGTVWRDTSGNLLSTPVEPADTFNGVVKTIAQNSGLINTNGFCLTDGDRGVFGYWTGNPCNYHVCNQRPSDGVWVDRQVGTQGISFTLVNNPSADSFPLCQPRMLYSSGNAYVFFRSTTYPGIWCYKISDAQLESGADLSALTPTQVCEYDAVGYAPCYDEPLFKETGRVMFFVSRVSNTDTDLGGNIPAFVAEITLP